MRWHRRRWWPARATRPDRRRSARRCPSRLPSRAIYPRSSTPRWVSHGKRWTRITSRSASWSWRASPASGGKSRSADSRLRSHRRFAWSHRRGTVATRRRPWYPGRRFPDGKPSSPRVRLHWRSEQPCLRPSEHPPGVAPGSPFAVHPSRRKTPRTGLPERAHLRLTARGNLPTTRFGSLRFGCRPRPRASGTPVRTL